MNKSKSIIGLIMLLVMSVAYVKYHNSEYFHLCRLEASVKNEDYDETKLILEQYDFNLNVPVGYANGIVTFLTNKKPMVPLLYACSDSNYAMVRLLINNGATANYVEGTETSPLLATLGCYQPNDLLIVRELLDAGAEINYCVNSIIPIAAAASMQPEIITAGSQSELSGVYNERAANEIKDIVDLLLKNGAMSKGDGLGQEFNLLNLASKAGNIILIEYLIEHKEYNANAQNSEGKTALFYVEEDTINYCATINCLIANGTKKTMQDIYGKKAYDYALESGNLNMAALLRP